jgi:uncharacterized protein YbjT (DUF2867 family)
VIAWVSGATGFVGRAVVERLRARGVKTIAHVRPESTKKGDFLTVPWEREALTVALRDAGATHVFNCVGTTRAQAREDQLDGDIYERVDHQLTRMLCEAAVSSGCKPRLVYLSSVGAGGRSPYFRARGRAEDAVRESGLPWVIARPSMIVAGRGGARRDDGRPMEKAGAVIGDGLLAVVGLVAHDTRAKYRSITPEALADALVRLGLDGEPGRVYEGSDLR